MGNSLVVVPNCRMKEGMGRFSSYERQVPICISSVNSVAGLVVLMLTGFDLVESIWENLHVYIYVK